MKNLIRIIAAMTAALIISIPCVASEHSETEIGEIEALARMLYGEARGVKSDTEKAACVWVVLNRVDDDRWPDDVVSVLTQKSQFSGYSGKNPVQDELYILCEDVYDRWIDGKEGGEDIGRIIPEDYFYWHGDGRHNWFRKGYYDKVYWDWPLESPYED